MKPVGRPTRGTTGTNRLRRVDRWIATLACVTTPDALVVDLGYGASARTTLELRHRLVQANPTIEVLGLEIDPERVLHAHQELLVALKVGRTRFGTPLPEDARISFARGGFELPTPRPPQLVRAMNVLRQYDEAEVVGIWAQLCSKLAPEGRLVEGTCSETGRVGSWVTLDRTGPLTLTFSLKVDLLGTPELPSPSILAERLPKALIHRNVPGEGVHEVLARLEDAWQRHAPFASFGARHRWLATVRAVKDAGLPVQHSARRWRLGELTLPWECVAPR